MKFQIHTMKDIKSGEIPEMKLIIEKIKERKRPIKSIKETLSDKINIITELKHSSPSAGMLAGAMNDAEIIQSYINGGASAVSVLTEKKYFGGSYEHLQSAGAFCGKPVLCKDFIYFEEQIDAAYLCGADMVLLISKALEKESLKKLYGKILNSGMTPLVEIHEASEIDKIMVLEPELVLVNMRNLETLEIDFKTGMGALKELPSSVTAISASGINSKNDIAFIMNETGTNNYLIGSSLMKSSDPERMIREFKDVY